MTTIKHCAFGDCIELESVTLPDSLKVIGSWAFSDCHRLKSITIPEGVTTIEDYAFEACEQLESVTLPDSLKVIGMEAFKACIELESVTLPDSLEAIGEWAFSSCHRLKSITIPEGVTTIEDYAFEACKELESVTLPDSLEAIGEEAFKGCSNLKSITCPWKITNIAEYVPACCDDLSDVTLQAFSRTKWIRIQNNKIAGEAPFVSLDIKNSYTIPASVSCDEPYGIEYDTEELVIPQSMKTIKRAACCDHTKLKVLRLPEKLSMFDSGFRFYRDTPEFFCRCPAVKYVFHGEKCIEVNGIDALGSAGENVIWIKHYGDTVTFLGKGEINFNRIKIDTVEYSWGSDNRDCLISKYAWDKKTSLRYYRKKYKFIFCEGVERRVFPECLAYDDRDFSASESPCYDITYVYE